jgi:nucleotide-binding universal stress UspA family protein
VKEILVAIDFSSASREALASARALAGRFGARLNLLYAIEPPTLPQWGYAHLALREAKLRREAQTRLQKLAHEPGLALQSLPTIEVRTGSSAESAICDAASERKADLIVIGTHGADRVRHALIGSTAERVVRHAPCPVLVVREGNRRPRRSRT